MSVYIDRSYLLLISSRLRNFKQKKDDLFNFSCPFCGDSKKNSLKARGYIYRKGNDYFYTCHNCQVGTTFPKFLNHVDTETYKRYVFDRYTNGENGFSNYKKPKIELAGPKPTENMNKLTIRNIDQKILCVEKLTEDHPAVQYLMNRKIPKEHWKEIFYTDKFKDFMDNTFKDHGKENIPNDDRIVLFYTNENGEITNVAGRTLGSSKIRYCVVRITDEKKVFGMHRLSKQNKAYILEGQFDSLFIPNSVASGDSNLCALGTIFNDNGYDFTIVFDAEPRNRDLVKLINKAIENNFSVCLLPETKYKDINEMVIGGLDPKEIKEIIDSNTYSGLEAKLKFIEWRKC